MTQEIDTTLVGHVAADLMERISDQFGEEATVETVAMVIEVRHSDGEEREATTITCSCSDPRAWAQAGLLRFAAGLVEGRVTEA
ncbi:MAG: hypothetical protein FJW90_06540 [Actinobacteria bacterium]|nr:hypothetical protein [Actinomycetota bacterium]